MFKLVFSFMPLCLFTLGLIALALPAKAENPHDGYMFWMPAGELNVGDPDSEKNFNYSTDEETVEMTIKFRRTRFDFPTGQLVVIRKDAKTSAEYTVDGQPAGKLRIVTFVPFNLSKGKTSITLSVKESEKCKHYSFYITDDADKLGLDINSAKDKVAAGYIAGVNALWMGKYNAAEKMFLSAEKNADSETAKRLLRKMARWAAASDKFQSINTGEGVYNLGLYAMQNGFWDLAVSAMQKAVDLMPNNPDAWYMLGDALSYKTSDFDMNMERIAPYYKKAADLYPSDNSNTFRNFFGFFTNLRIDDKTVLHMTEEQMAYVKKVWDWNSSIMAAASKGALRLVNTYKVIEEETDNTNTWSPYPFGGHFKPGEIETYFKMTGWGASDACGPDCGPDRSAMINMGLREWDVMLHEWNHTLDWMMICSELGVGVPTTHSSDWCGLQPISTMGMGHHSCNRYYMTPGMYRYIKGSDYPSTKPVEEWKATPAKAWRDKVSTVDDEYEKTWNAKVKTISMPKDDEFTISVKAVNGYADLTATLGADDNPNRVSFARAYVYSPLKQKVRMWYGADDHARIWLNGKLIHKGIYTSVCLFQDARDPNHIAKGVMLEKGWNELTIQITNRQYGENWIVPNPPPDSWGFGIRFCDIKNNEVPGLKYSSVKPKDFVMPTGTIVNAKNPAVYNWFEVADDYTMLLPALTIDDLRAITGYKTLTVNDDMFFDLTKEQLPPSITKFTISKSEVKDQTFNNHLNWYFSPKEMTAVVRFMRDGKPRDLVLLRPEAYEAYLKLMKVDSSAQKQGIKSHAHQVIGTFMVDREDCPNGRGGIILDTYLGDNLPADEEALMDISHLK